MRFTRIKNNHGYTLIESVMQLVIFAFAAQLIFLIVYLFLNQMSLREARDEIEWQLFVADLNIYFERSHSYTLDNLGKRLEFTDPKSRTTVRQIIEVRNAHIAKASIMGGHEIILPHITYAKFTLRNGVFSVYAIMQTGKIRERSFVIDPNPK